MAEHQSFNLLFVVGVIRKYIWYIVGLLLLAAISAIVATMPFFYPPEFRSSTVIYPTSPERFDVVNIFAEEPRVFVYGDSKEVEKLDNLASSDAFQLMIIDSIDLWTEFGVDLNTSKSPKYEALKVYDSRIRTIRIAGNGLEIEAFDTQPQRAADIVNLIVQKVNEWNKRMLLENRLQIAGIYANSMDQLESRLTTYEDSARKLREKYNILHYETQTEVMVDRILETQIRLNTEQAKLEAYRKVYQERDTALINTGARVKGLQRSLAALRSSSSNYDLTLHKFREGYDEVRALEEIYIRLAMSIKETREKIEYLQMMNKAEVNTIMIMGEAQPADRKSRPVRWLILAATLLVTGLVAVMGVVLIDLLALKLGEETSRE